MPLAATLLDLVPVGDEGGAASGVEPRLGGGRPRSDRRPDRWPPVRLGAPGRRRSCRPERPRAAPEGLRGEGPLTSRNEVGRPPLLPIANALPPDGTCAVRGRSSSASSSMARPSRGLGGVSPALRCPRAGLCWRRPHLLRHSCAIGGLKGLENLNLASTSAVRPQSAREAVARQVPGLFASPLNGTPGKNIQMSDLRLTV